MVNGTKQRSDDPFWQQPSAQPNEATSETRARLLNIVQVHKQENKHSDQLNTQKLGN